MNRVVGLLLALLFAPPLDAAPVPKALKNPRPLDGTWKVTDWHYSAAHPHLDDDITWTIEGETLTVTWTKAETPSGVAANATRTITRPAGGAGNAVDFTIRYGDGTPTSVRPAVVELGGDTLKLCMSTTHNGPRPSECKPADGAILYVLKRVDATK
jgi:uncharacterized protein (TIGR03067 family)